MLDFGCGRGTDAAAFDMDAFDPYWPENNSIHRPTFADGTTALYIGEQLFVLNEMEYTLPSRHYDTITCTYVLNVISEGTAEQMLGIIQGALRPGGTAYITVRRDLPVEGKPGRRGVFQRYVTLDLPVLYERKGNFIIYVLHKADGVYP